MYNQDWFSFVFQAVKSVQLFLITSKWSGRKYSDKWFDQFEKDVTFYYCVYTKANSLQIILLYIYIFGRVVEEQASGLESIIVFWNRKVEAKLYIYNVYVNQRQG